MKIDLLPKEVIEEYKFYSNHFGFMYRTTCECTTEENHYYKFTRTDSYKDCAFCDAKHYKNDLDSFIPLKIIVEKFDINCLSEYYYQFKDNWKGTILSCDDFLFDDPIETWVIYERGESNECKI